MVMPPRPSSSGMRSTDRELQHRRPNKPLAPRRPAAKKPSAPAPRPSSAATRPQPRRSRSFGSASAATADCAAPRLKPGAAVLVRTRTEKMVAGKAVVLWLPAVVVSATDDGGYEVVYEGELPRWDPFATVQVQRDHVRPQKPSAPPLPSSAAGPCAPATATLPAASKNLEMQPALRPELPRPDTS